jgi:hypothetical protein
MVHIDVGAILQESVNSVYTDLVTRATGRTVRSQIEHHIASGRPGTVAVIDFSNVGLLDFSCADEIVASLLRQCCADSPTFERYLLFAGMSDDQLDAIEYVLERQRLALVVRITAGGNYRLVGMVDETERVVWETVTRCQPADGAVIAAETGLSESDAESRLASLHRRRLIMREGAAYRAPSGAVA